MENEIVLTVKTACLITIATASGLAGFNLAQWDIILGIIFKSLGCISTLLIIIINWSSLVKIIRGYKIFKKKKE